MNIIDERFSELIDLQLVNRGPVEFHTNDVSSLSDREAMGLPTNYLTGGLEALGPLFMKFSSLPKGELVKITESRTEDFYNRFVAGQILSLTGDPRINVEKPVMIAIDSWSGFLGLDEKDIDKVCDEFEKYGVKRDWIAKESPRYFKTIDSFRIGKYLVTNFEYLEFLKDTHYEEIPTSWPFRQYPLFYANNPVYSIHSDAAVKYAEWLSVKTNRKFRLPTEAEWEYVAGGPTGREYPWGEFFEKDHANTLESGIFQTTAVGMFPKGDSFFGCADMAGNVEEYVSDFYAGYSGSLTVNDDLVSVNGDYRVARGGSFTRFRDLARCRRRHGPNPKEIYAMGFRLAEDID